MYCSSFSAHFLGRPHWLHWKHGAPGKLHGITPTRPGASTEHRGLPGGQKRRERVPVHTDSHVFLRSLPLWYNAGLLPLQKAREEKDQRVHAPGARGGAAGVGRAAQEAQPHLSRRRVGTALGAGVPAFLREPRQPLCTSAPRGCAALSACVRAVHGAKQHQLPVLLRGHALRHRGGVGQRHGGGEREGGVREQRGWLRLSSARRHRHTEEKHHLKRRTRRSPSVLSRRPELQQQLLNNLKKKTLPNQLHPWHDIQTSAGSDHEASGTCRP